MDDSSNLTYHKLVDRLLELHLLQSFDESKWSIDTEDIDNNKGAIRDLEKEIEKITNKYTLLTGGLYGDYIWFKIMDIEL